MINSSNGMVRCSACATANRVLVARLGAGGTCGRCGAPLFTGEPLD
ncbi:hypothetical protein [Sphingomonas melonis]